MGMQEQETEIVLMPNEYCYYLDKTKGNMNVVVGPFKQSLSQTDQLMEWSDSKKGFVRVEYNHAKRNNIVIPEGWYAPLKNPAMNVEHPPRKTISDMQDAGLNVGKKVNISGPANFALWPGQMCKVIEGHKLRSNQYLLVRVYDVAAFKRELSKSDEIESAEGGGIDNEVSKARRTSVYDGLVEDNLATGQQFIIKGTHVHFYIPPDGIEVIPFSDSKSGYVHNAVTLEQLQYCILQDEGGNKRYVRGPAVVFPEPTEKFLSAKGGSGVAAKKFGAVELNETSGIYVEVIKEYKDGEFTYREGDELFITGKDQKIYFPREEHAIIKYGDQDRHYAVALPVGEGRYVLDRVEGYVSTVMGPTMFLPDPRRQVIVQRILSARETNLLFPGNTEVRDHNARLREEDTEVAAAGVQYRARSERDGTLGAVLSASRMMGSTYGDSFSMDFSDDVAKGVMGDAIDREGQYRPPRSITLKTKFDGVVAFDVWNGYAVMISSRCGERRVVEGPRRVYLDYDETPESVTLSTGTPKNHDSTIETAFLRTSNNVVGELIRGVETSDLCEADIRISMRVDFAGDDKFKWFAVDNYIKLLSERVTSLLKNHIRRIPVMEFYSDSTNIVRSILLGESKDGDREGLVFEDNGMVVSEVEVLDVRLHDHELATRLRASAGDALGKAITLEEQKRDLAHTIEVTKISADRMSLKNESEMLSIELNKKSNEAALEADRIRAEQKAKTAEAQVLAENVRKDAEIANHEKMLALEEKSANAMLKVKLAEMEAEAKKVQSIMGSVSPQLTAALQSIGDNHRIERVTAAIAPQNIFGDKGMLELLKAQFEAMGMSTLWKRIGVGTEAGEIPQAPGASVSKKTKK